MKNRRHTRMQWCEVVRVDSPLFLISSWQQARHYETTDGKPLAAGYYLALWPAGACRSSYGCALRYLGPFANKATARLLHASALALGIVDLEVDSDRNAVHLLTASKDRQQSRPLPGVAQVTRVDSRVYQAS